MWILDTYICTWSTWNLTENRLPVFTWSKEWIIYKKTQFKILNVFKCIMLSHSFSHFSQNYFFWIFCILKRNFSCFQLEIFHCELWSTNLEISRKCSYSLAYISGMKQPTEMRFVLWDRKQVREHCYDNKKAKNAYALMCHFWIKRQN